MALKNTFTQAELDALAKALRPKIVNGQVQGVTLAQAALQVFGSIPDIPGTPNVDLGALQTAAAPVLAKSNIQVTNVQGGQPTSSFAGQTSAATSAVPTAAGAQQVFTHPTQGFQVTEEGLNQNLRALTGAPSGTAQLNVEQQTAQLQSQLEQQALRGQLSAEGLTESGIGEQRKDLSDLRRELLLGATAPEAPRTGGGGGRRVEEPQLPQAPQPTARPSQVPVQALTGAQPAQALELEPLPDLSHLQKALQAQRDREQELRHTGLENQAIAPGSGAIGQLGGTLDPKIMTGVQRDINLTSPEAAFRMALQDTGQAAPTLQENAVEALRALGRAKNITAQIDQLKTQLDQPDQRMQALENQANQLVGVLNAGGYHTGETDPVTGEPAVRPLSELDRTRLEGQLRALGQSMQRNPQRDQQQQKMRELIQARKQQVKAITARMKAHKKMRDMEFEDAAKRQAGKEAGKEVAMKRAAAVEVQRLEAFARTAPHAFTSKEARESFFTMMKLVPGKTLQKANQIAQQTGNFMDARNFLIDQEGIL